MTTFDGFLEVGIQDINALDDSSDPFVGECLQSDAVDSFRRLVGNAVDDGRLEDLAELVGTKSVFEAVGLGGAFQVVGHTANVAILHPRAIHGHAALKLGVILREVAMEGLHLESIDLLPDKAPLIRPPDADRGLATLPDELDALVLGRLVAPVEVVDQLLDAGREEVNVAHRGLSIVHSV